MAIQTYFSPVGNANGLQPTIIAPTTGDLEEARIRRLIELAKLKQLQQDPLVQQQQLALQQSQVSEAGRHNVATEAEAHSTLEATIKQHQTDALLRQAGLDIDQRGQDVTARGQDINARTAVQGEVGLNERAQLAAQTQTTDTLIGHILGNFPQAEDKMQLAKVLALRGNPELLKVLTESGKTGTGDPLADATLEYMKNKKAATPAAATNSTLDLLKKLLIAPSAGLSSSIP